MIMKLPSLTLLALFAVWLLQPNAVAEGASLKHYRNVRRARIPRQFIEPSPTAQNTALNCDSVRTFRQNTIFCLFYKVKNALTSETTYMELIRHKLFQSNPSADDVIAINLNITVKLSSSRSRITVSYPLQYSWCNSLFKLAVYDANLLTTATSDPLTFLLGLLSGYLKNLNFGKAINGNPTSWLTSAYYGGCLREQNMPLSLEITVPYWNCKMGELSLREAWERMAPWLKEYAKEKEDEELNERGYVSRYFSRPQCSNNSNVTVQLNANNPPVQCTNDSRSTTTTATMPIPSNLLDEQSPDSAGSGILGDERGNDDDNTEDSNDNTNQFYISDYDYYYYDITDWVDDWLEYYFYYDYDLFEESSSNFYIGSSTVPVTFHDHLGNIFLASHILLNLLVCILMVQLGPVYYLNLMKKSQAKSKSVLLSIFGAFALLASLYNIIRIAWIPSFVPLLLIDNSPGLKFLLADCALVPITLAVELIVIICVIYPSQSLSLPKLPRLTKLWFTCCCLQKCCNISDKFIHVLVLWNLVAFMQLFFAGVTLRVLPLLASDVFLTTMGISLLVSGGFCLLMLLASLLHVSRSFKLSNIQSLISVVLQGIAAVLGVSLVVLGMVVYAAFLNDGGDGNSFNSWVLGLLPSGALAVVGWFLKKNFLLDDEEELGSEEKQEGEMDEGRRDEVTVNQRAELDHDIRIESQFQPTESAPSSHVSQIKNFDSCQATSPIKKMAALLNTTTSL